MATTAAIIAVYPANNRTTGFINSAKSALPMLTMTAFIACPATVAADTIAAVIGAMRLPNLDKPADIPMAILDPHFDPI